MKRTKSTHSAQMPLIFGSSLTITAARTQDKKRPAPSGDWVLPAIALVLAMIGLVMVYNASSLIGEKTYHDSLYFIKRQLLWFLFGVAAFFISAHARIERLRSWMIPMTAMVFILLLSVLIAGFEINGARRWLRMGVLTFQPSELAKLFTVFYLAHYIDKKGERLRYFSEGAFRALIVTGLMSMLILLEPD
ncbi:MAG: FtsW/RodA/SpoVE family cell cycle protein, partial [Nitrospiria bacterium]